MLTIAETEVFSAIWPRYWTADEFGEFCAWLALNPEAGDVIPHTTLTQGFWQESGRRSMAKLRGKALAKFEASRNLGEELLNAAREIKSGKVAREHHIKVPEVRETRMRSGLSQQEFADVLGVSRRTLEGWEQGRRRPTGPARSLLTIAAKRPDVLLEIFAD